jgi:hypothetical protein
MLKASEIYLTDDVTAQDLLDGIMSMQDDLCDKNVELRGLMSQKILAQIDYDSSLQLSITCLRESKYPLPLLLSKAKSQVAAQQQTLDNAKLNILCLREDISLIKTQIDCYRSLLSWLKVELLNS